MKNKNNEMITVGRLAYWGGKLSYDNLPLDEGFKIIMPDGVIYYFDEHKSILHKWHHNKPEDYELLLHSVWGPLYVRFMDTYRFDKNHIKKAIRSLSQKPQTNHRLNLSIWKHIDRPYYLSSVLEKAAFSTRINMDNAWEAAQIIHLRKTYTKEGLKLMAYSRLLSKMP